MPYALKRYRRPPMGKMEITEVQYERKNESVYVTVSGPVSAVAVRFAFDKERRRAVFTGEKGLLHGHTRQIPDEVWSGMKRRATAEFLLQYNLVSNPPPRAFKDE